jgi:D-alanyl-lipoteichoic acid acyltransferase DltB (MBOAT superfamily)
MTEQLINLSDLEFWLVFLTAITLVNPITNIYHKSILWAGINCGFVLLLLKLHGFIMLGIIIIIYLLLQSIAGKYRILSTVAAGLATFLLFIFHKTQPIVILEQLTATKTVLSVCGFSYVALRMVEVIRAVFEKRYSPPSPIECINYLIPFHMLGAGPIQSYDDFINHPISKPPSTLNDTLEGFERISKGLFKKFVLAYCISDLFLTGFSSNGIYFFIEVQLFFLWLYLDFSAYSDIAIGIGRILGISTPENFNKPYLARNIVDFWERWHMSLSLFIRRNVFIPLQLYLNRRADGRTPLISASIAFSLSFLLCGLWHGLSINFLLWGAIHAFGLIIANIYKTELKKRLGRQQLKQYMSNRLLRYAMRVLTYEYVAFSLVILFFP